MITEDQVTRDGTKYIVVESRAIGVDNVLLLFHYRILYYYARLFLLF